MRTKMKTASTHSSAMGRGERLEAMTYARTLMADAKLPRNSALTRVGAAYDGALATARAVCGVANYSERPDLETFLDAANQLRLDDAWRAEAPVQATRHNRETRLFCLGPELPTEADATRTVRWAETLFNAADAHLRKIDPGLF